MREIRTSGSMSGEGKRSHWPCLNATAPFLDSTAVFAPFVLNILKHKGREGSRKGHNGPHSTDAFARQFTRAPGLLNP